MPVAFTYEFLTARAEQAAQEAACALLENVRVRSLRSEAAWRYMANQVFEVARNRELGQTERSLLQLAPVM
jgi:hypothetical protein